MMSSFHSIAQVMLAHHSEKDLNRCFSMRIQGNRLHICTRCSGVCIGGLLYAVLPLKIPQPLLLILVCFSIVDYILFAWGKWDGNNSVRFLSGCLLGIVQIENLCACKTGTLSPFLITSNLVCVIAFLVVLWRRKSSYWSDRLSARSGV